MKPKGFTLIELMIVVAIIGILAAVIAPLLMDKKPGQPVIAPYTAPPAVFVEECISGFRFVVSGGKATQLIDEDGKGVKCL